jgi:hypothetical protein
MGTTELAEALGVTKGLVSQLAKRGMPLTSPEAAQAWREANAKPRRWKNKSPSPTPPASKPQAATKPSQVIAAADDPHASLERARSAEREAFAALKEMQSNGGSPEDLRKSSATYFSSRRNRELAEHFFDAWQRRQEITLLLAEAKELVGRPHLAAKQLLEVMPKALAPRLYGQPMKAIEATLADWADNLTEILRQAP